MLNSPKVVPILDVDDIYKGGMVNPKNSAQCCLIGWALRTFGDYSNGKEVQITLQKEINKINPHMLISSYNDDPAVSKVSICKIWNATMKKLGYTEIVNRKGHD